MQFPFAMRDLPPVTYSAVKTQNPDHEREETVVTANGRLPSCPGAPPAPRPVPCPPTGSPTVPPRPTHSGRGSSQILPLKRQLVSQVSLDSPLSPASRPRSPWGSFDPYDSPEVSSIKLSFYSLYKYLNNCCQANITYKMRMCFHLLLTILCKTVFLLF